MCIRDSRETAKSTEEKCLGWVSLTDVLDNDFENANYALGDYLIFSLRIDRKLIPPKLMKIKLMEEERRFLAQSGKNRINKQMAGGIKDKVKLELLTKLDPIPSFYDVCWACLLYTSPSPRDRTRSRMPSSA